MIWSETEIFMCGTLATTRNYHDTRCARWRVVCSCGSDIAARGLFKNDKYQIGRFIYVSLSNYFYLLCEASN